MKKFKEFILEGYSTQEVDFKKAEGIVKKFGLEVQSATLEKDFKKKISDFSSSDFVFELSDEKTPRVVVKNQKKSNWFVEFSKE